MFIVVGVKSGGCLDFKCAYSFRIFYNQVYLSPGLIPEKAQVGLFTGIIGGFEKIVYNHVFKDGPSQRIIIQLLGFLYSEQITQQAGITEI